MKRDFPLWPLFSLTRTFPAYYSRTRNDFGIVVQPHYLTREKCIIVEASPTKSQSLTTNDAPSVVILSSPLGHCGGDRRLFFADSRPWLRSPPSNVIQCILHRLSAYQVGALPINPQLEGNQQLHVHQHPLRCPADGIAPFCASSASASIGTRYRMEM